MAEPLDPMDFEARMKALPPERNPDGSPNIEYYRAKYSVHTDIGLRYMNDGKITAGYAQVLAALDKETTRAGFDPRHVRDMRSDKEKIADAIQALVAMHNGEEILELTTELVERIQREMANAVELMAEQIEEEKAKARGRTRGDPAGKARTLQRWIDLLGRVKKIQTWAREAIPKVRELDEEGRSLESWEASHTLRYMVYVGRSEDAAKKTGRPADAVFLVEPHWVEMSRRLWEATENVMYHHDAKAEEVEVVRNYHERWPKLHAFEGVFYCLPTGHGKTSFIQHGVGLMVCKNPHHQVIFLHSSKPEASRVMTYTANLFDEKQQVGRRTRVLFPRVPAVARKNGDEMRFALDHHLKSATLTAYGLNSSGQGVNASILVLDDSVDQAEAHEETTRERTFSRINGTWMKRLRPGGFHITACTLWHPDDANARRMKLALQEKTKVMLCRIPTGGPEPGNDVRGRWRKAFDPVSERIPAKKLRADFASMNDPVLFAAQYQCDPQSSSARIIKRLRFYDPFDQDWEYQHLPPEDRPHARFKKSCIHRLSIDPAATNSEKSDKAGVVYMGEGTVTWRGSDGVIHEERRIRILDAFQIRANQSEIVEHAGMYTLDHPTDYVHIETRAAFHATAEMWQNRWGTDVIRHDPTNQKKGVRLKNCASMLEDINSRYGVRAVVEFPGVRNAQGHLEIRPDIAWLADQILNFGMTKGDHGVDALTQVLNHVAPDMGIGTGEVSRAVQRVTVQTGRDPRLVEAHKQLLRGPGQTNPDEMDDQWMRSQWQ